jgi:nanoRNase/pAp phosphatase (c-di-AMP/oligoRNAs hydrolase)
MRIVAFCQSRTAADLVRGLAENRSGELAFLCESERLERYLRRKGHSVSRGRFRDREVLRRILPADLLVVYLRDERRLSATLEAVARARETTPALVLCHTPVEDLHVEPSDFSWAQFVPVRERVAASLRAEVHLALAKDRVQELRAALGDARKVLILMQDDPDPDALASGLALRQLLGRNRTSAPLGSFGKVTRPENVAMMRLLDLEVLKVTRRSIKDFDRVALVDTQPPHLRRNLPRVDVVIDHHPEQSGYEVTYKDVRSNYGATATIMCEYLRARGEKLHERLSTALLYAIRTDTLLLERNVTEMDVEAFTYLYPRANLNQIRRIERPELPVTALQRLAEAFKDVRVVEGVIFSHLGRISREDIIPQMAEFCLQVEGADWSVVSGVHEDELIMSVRNVGFVQAAGTVVKGAYKDIGLAGGHRSMAKAIFSLASLRRNGQGLPSKSVYQDLESRFLAQIRGLAETVSK